VLGQGENFLEFLMAVLAEIVIHGHGDLPQKLKDYRRILVLF
jgi:hypothetical protein